MPPERALRAAPVCTGPGARVGFDLVHVEEVDRALARYGRRYLERCYCDHELAACTVAGHMSATRLAAVFAAKEATLKALEPAEGDGPVPGFRAIEVRAGRSGALVAHLGGAAAALARRRAIVELSCSVSSRGGYATAIVVARRGDADPASGKGDPGATRGRTQHVRSEAAPRAGRPERAGTSTGARGAGRRTKGSSNDG